MKSSPHETSVKSFVRIKPKEGILKVENKTIKIINKNNKIYSFEFDHIFGPESTTNDIFQELTQDLKLKDPRNLTILAYGQTGSGKTYTISGSNTIKGNEKGLIQKIINFLIETQELKISCIEIYNEKIIDAIDNKEKILREINEKFYIQDLTKRNITNPDEFQSIWDIFMNNRRIAQTNLNISSSRSHSIVRIETLRNVINLVDLAGSENNKKTGNSGERMRESQNINTSLFVLNKVVSSIIKKEPRVPYRDSKLTRILKESFSGESRCYIIATVIDEIDEDGLSVNTLGFASKSRQILTIEKPNILPLITELPAKHFSVNMKKHKIDTLTPSSIETRDNCSCGNITNQRLIDETKTSEKKTISSVNEIKNDEQINKKNRNSNKTSDSSSIIRGLFVNSQIEMTPVTKQKSRECFINKALEYENSENYKLALDMYKTAFKISQSKELEDKIIALSKMRKMAVTLISEATALHALNSGSFIEIKKLNGIGDKRAKMITDFIDGGNYFESLEDLKMLFNQKIVDKILEGIKR